MKAPQCLELAALGGCIVLCGCESYSTDALDAQGALDARYRRGEISWQDYEQQATRLRGAESLGTADPRPAFHQTY